MVTRRQVLAAFSLALAGRATLRAGGQSSGPTKVTTVTLIVDGMT